MADPVLDRWEISPEMQALEVKVMRSITSFFDGSIFEELGIEADDSTKIEWFEDEEE